MNTKQLADKLTTELTNNLNYSVTDDVQLFNEDMELGGEPYVPVLASLITSLPNENKYITTVTYQLTFKVAVSKIDLFYADMENFRDTQVNEIIGSDYVSKVIYREVYQREDVENSIDYREFTVDMIWTYALSVVGSQSVIKIDTFEIPFLTCSITHDIGYVSNEAHDTAYDNYRLSNDTILLEIPLILADTKVNEIYDEINSNSYNKTYVLDINGVSKTVVLKQSQVTLTRNGGLTSMILTLETAYPRVSITLDGESIPVTAYRYNGKVTTTDGKKSSLDAILRTHGVSKVRSWSITFVKDGSTIYDKIVNDVYGNTLDTTYELVRDGKTYTLMLADAVEEYTETGDMSIQCQFIDYSVA